MGQAGSGQRPDKERAILERRGSASWGERLSLSGLGQSEPVNASICLIIIWSNQFEIIVIGHFPFVKKNLEKSILQKVMSLMAPGLGKRARRPLLALGGGFNPGS
jgi:hypothetical protein